LDGKARKGKRVPVAFHKSRGCGLHNAFNAALSCGGREFDLSEVGPVVRDQQPLKRPALRDQLVFFQPNTRVKSFREFHNVFESTKVWMEINFMLAWIGKIGNYLKKPGYVFIAAQRRVIYQHLQRPDTGSRRRFSRPSVPRRDVRRLTIRAERTLTKLLQKHRVLLQVSVQAGLLFVVQDLRRGASGQDEAAHHYNGLQDVD